MFCEVLVQKSEKGNSELKDDPYRQVMMAWEEKTLHVLLSPPLGCSSLFLSNLDILGNNFPRGTFFYENLLRCFWVFHLDTQAANLC